MVFRSGPASSSSVKDMVAGDVAAAILSCQTVASMVTQLDKEHEVKITVRLGPVGRYL